MIEFLSEEIRTRFHRLPADEQLGFVRLAERLATTGSVLTVVDVEQWGKASHEISIRIDEKFDGIRPGEPQSA